jgi:aminoglycoside phosphotransferase (APT) family kinase protein
MARKTKQRGKKHKKRYKRPRPTGPRRTGPDHRQDEPRPFEEDLVQWGQDVIVAAGFTSGGAPYGTSVAEFREASLIDACGADWARAQIFLARAARATGADVEDVDVGWVRHLGRGFHRSAYAAEVYLGFGAPGFGEPETWVALLARNGASPEHEARTRNEAEVLSRLAGYDLPLRIPRLVAVADDDGRPAAILTGVFGTPLDPQAGRQDCVRPWQVLAEVTAAVHGVPRARLEGLPGYATCRQHGEAELNVFDRLAGSVLDDASVWAAEHLPSPRPTVLVVGGLRPENILLSDDEPHGLIGWEEAKLGDPASDLASVTRGHRGSLKISDGFKRLLDAYADCGGQEVTAQEVRFYELCGVARRYRQALDSERPDAEMAELAAMRRLLERV